MLRPLTYSRLALVAVVALALLAGCFLAWVPGAAGPAAGADGRGGQATALHATPLSAAALGANAKARPMHGAISRLAAARVWPSDAFGSAGRFVSAGSGVPERPFSLRMRI